MKPKKLFRNSRIVKESTDNLIKREFTKGETEYLIARRMKVMEVGKANG